MGKEWPWYLGAAVGQSGKSNGDRAMIRRLLMWGVVIDGLWGHRLASFTASLRLQARFSDRNVRWSLGSSRPCERAIL